MMPWTPRPSASSTRGTNQTILPSSSMSAPQALETRATIDRPRPKVEQEVVLGVAVEVGQVGRLTRTVAHLDARVLAGAAQPHAHRLLGVQQRVGDHLGDADGRRTRPARRRSISVSTWAAHRRASETPLGPGVKAWAGRFSGMRTPGREGERQSLALVPRGKPDQTRSLVTFVSAERTFSGGISRRHAEECRGNRVARARRGTPDIPAAGVRTETWTPVGRAGRGEEEDRKWKRSPQIRRRGEGMAHEPSVRHPAPCGGHRVRLRRTVRDQGAQARRRRHHPGRQDQPPPVPAAALPGRDRHLVPGRDRAVDARDPQPPGATPRCCSARWSTSTSRPAP